MIQTTKLDLFAGISVADYRMALEWYEQLLGGSPAFFPHDTEAVWELAEGCVRSQAYVWLESKSSVMIT